jgi:hypothetical protein
MRRTLFIGCLLLFAVISAYAQSMPTIEYFTVDKEFLNYPAVEGGTETAVFNWRAINLREGDRMQMHALVGGQWGLIGTDFEPEKSDTLVIAHPLDFAMPQYRLSVVDASGTIVAEAFLELPYASQTELPVISMFLALHPMPTITMSQLDEPFQVQWQVRNRWFNSNLIFEQILPDGTVLNAEVARPAWQYAHKADYLQLVYPGDYADVVLRLRVINVYDGSTLVQQDLVLAITDSPVAPAEVLTFSATPEVVNPGESVTINWEVTNSDVVFIEYYEGWINNSCPTIYRDLPLSGSLTVTAPELAFRGLQFLLFTDFYVGGSRHHCGSFREPAAELTVDVTDYIGQGVGYFRPESYYSTFGEQVILSWEVSEGDSVTILQLVEDRMPSLGEAPIAYETYSNLPLAGTLEVTIPDNQIVRTSITRHFLLYIIEAEPLPTFPDAAVHILIDEDGNPECDAVLNIGDNENGIDTEFAAPETELLVEWDSCGNENTLLYLAMREGNYNDPLVSEEYLPVEPSGAMPITMPAETGEYYIELYYEHEGERYFLRGSSVIIESAQG